MQKRIHGSRARQETEADGVLAEMLMRGDLRNASMVPKKCGSSAKNGTGKLGPIKQNPV
jgi:hypothetical protein